MSKVEVKKISSADLHDIHKFLEMAGSSLASFRYFDKRPVSIIDNHLVTALLYEDQLPVGYGHLDSESKHIWLGIAVQERVKGKGYGKFIMQFLIDWATSNQIKELVLSVDKTNIPAIELYKKFGFAYERDINDRSILMIVKIESV